MIAYQDDRLVVHQGDALAVLQELPDESVHCVVTSPPYWGLRDYGSAGQLGLERTPDEYVEALVAIFREVRRVLRVDGTVWLNLGDSYAAERGGTHQPAETLAGGRHGKTVGGERVNRGRADGYSPSRNASAIGLKHKDLVGVPWLVAFALRADGWWLRRDVIWNKPNGMPESVEDRPTSSHEYVFLLTRAERYYYDGEAVREPAVSGPSDLRKMAEGKDRIGGLVKELDDPKAKASSKTNIGRKRSVGGRSLKQDAGAQAQTGTRGDRLNGFNGRWAEAEASGTAPVGRNLRSVWTVTTQPYPGAHFATFPPKLIEPMILAGCPRGGVVLDPFAGSGTTGLVAASLGRRAILIELNPDYVRQAIARATGGFVDPGGQEVPDDSLWAAEAVG